MGNCGCGDVTHGCGESGQVLESLGQEIGKLVDTKQEVYGNSFGKSGDIMRILYPNGISLDQIDDALCIVRIVDKLFRLATNRDALGESPYRDISGYGMLGAGRAEMALTGKGEK
jgi:hypothetical protein